VYLRTGTLISLCVDRGTHDRCRYMCGGGVGTLGNGFCLMSLILRPWSRRMLMIGACVVYVCLEGVLACVRVCTCVCVRTCAYDWVWAQNTLKNACYADIERNLQTDSCIYRIQYMCMCIYVDIHDKKR